METIANLASTCRAPTAHDKVLNGECCYSFQNPFHPDGLLVSLQHWIGVAPALAGGGIYVRIKKTREKLPEPEDAPKKLAIGVEGGFEQEKYKVISKHSIVVIQDGSVAVELPFEDTNKESFPEMVTKAAEAVICHAGLTTQQAVQSWQLDTNEETPVSKYAADLPFVDNGVVISPNPSDWKCQKSGDTENIWLNLSDGFIGGGRKNWDGSGGSNGALDHFQETDKKYPLVVKLGTITADLETADCYSYAPDEDGPVKIPNLKELLAKRGIHAGGLQKTVKSTAELEVELNANYAFDAITEAGASLTPVTGPHYQGLQNLGNSCYMNSILQLLLDLPEFAHRYGTTSDKIEKHPLQQALSPTAAPTDLLCQTAKIASAITSGAFSKPLDVEDDNDPRYRVAPRMFKHLIGKDHVDFCTGQQQDAAQFLQYLLEQIDRAELGASNKKHLQPGKLDEPMHVSSHLFSYQHQQRLICSADQKLKYKSNPAENMWSLRIPMELATAVDITSPEHKRQKSEDNAKEEEEEEEPVPTIALTTCIDEWAKEQTVTDLRWSHLQNSVHSAQQTMRFENFPRYLLVQVQRYQLGADWQPIKLKVEVQLPKDGQLDLTALKATGPQQGEDLLPEESEESNAVSGTAGGINKPALDESAIAQLMDMGFSLNSCKRALTAVGGGNVEAAMGWVFEHNTDPDFNDPLPEDAGAATSSGSSGVDEGVVQSLVASLGCFSADQVRAALKETSGAADRAADWLFSHMDDLDNAIAALANKNASSSSSAPKVPLEDGNGKYTLTGMVSHIGKHTGSGHYVAHMKKDDKWVIFNDEKVALSSSPPFAHAYLYLFQRTDTIGKPNPNY